MERVLANHWRHTQKYMLGMIRDVHTVVALKKRLQKGKKQGATISKGSGGKVRKKTAGTGRVKVKLWRPRHVKRTGKDLHELDICLTVYDEIVREAL